MLINSTSGEARVHARREGDSTSHDTLGCRSVGEDRDDYKRKQRDPAIPEDEISPSLSLSVSRRGYLSHTWAGLLATALLFRSLAGLSIQFVVRAFLIGQTLIRRNACGCA
jgi:hypothetical protein